MSHARSEYEDFKKIAPDAYELVLALGQVAAKAGLDKQLLELVKLRASQINGCAFCVQHHILLSERLGVPVDKLNLVAVWREAPIFSARERAALAWAEALTLLPDGVSERSMRRCARILRDRADVPDVGNRLDQRLEPVWRGLSLDAGEAAGRGECRGILIATKGRLS